MLSAQEILEEMGLPIGATIPLPYGLTLTISMPSNLESICDDGNQLQALGGLLSTCQGIMLTLGEVKLLDLAHLLLIVNPELGVIATVRDAGIVRYASRINPNISIEEFINSCLIESGLLDEVQEMLDIDYEIPFQILPFDDLVPLWWKIVNSGMIYVLRDNYRDTNYSIEGGISGLAWNYFR